MTNAENVKLYVCDCCGEIVSSYAKDCPQCGEAVIPENKWLDMVWEECEGECVWEWGDGR